MKNVSSWMVALSLLPSTLHAEDAAPAAQTSTTKPALVIVGESFLAMSWLVSAGAVVGTTSCEGGMLGPSGVHCHSFSGWLFVPIMGPGIALADNAAKKTIDGEIPFYAASTAVNVAALATIVVGYATRPPVSKKRIRFIPALQTSARGASVGLTGTF